MYMEGNFQNLCVYAENAKPKPDPFWVKVLYENRSLPIDIVAELCQMAKAVKTQEILVA